jgi:hypothetical protein
MFQTRSLTTGFLVASLGIAAGFAVLGSPNLASADAGCDKLKVAEVKAVCAKGGVAAVKKSMKAAMDAANAADKTAKLECKSCHTELTEYKTNDKAEGGFKKHLAANFK